MQYNLLSVSEAEMGSTKRKTIEDPSEEYRPLQKQQRDSGPVIVDEPVACLHDVSYPEGYLPRASTSNLPEKDAKPAKEFPFTLDPFQSEAIKCLNNGESVMVRSVNFSVAEVSCLIRSYICMYVRFKMLILLEFVCRYQHIRRLGKLWSPCMQLLCP